MEPDEIQGALDRLLKRAEKVCRVQGEHVEFMLTHRSVL